MRNLVLCLFVFGGCSDDNLMGNMSDLSVLNDLTPVVDLSMRMPDGVTCGNMTCNSPMVCCIKPGAGGTTSTCEAPGACGDGGAEVMCDGPEDCPSTMHNCCANAKFSLGAGDAAPMAQGANAACGSDAACPAGVDLAAQVLHTKLCHTTADCAGYMGSTPLGNADFDGCCTSDQAPGVKFCAPTQFMGGNRYTCN
jgi:hypothetical protein